VKGTSRTEEVVCSWGPTLVSVGKSVNTVQTALTDRFIICVTAPLDGALRTPHY